MSTHPLASLGATEVAPSPGTGHGGSPHRAPATTRPARVRRRSGLSSRCVRHHGRHESVRGAVRATPRCSWVEPRPSRSALPLRHETSAEAGGVLTRPIPANTKADVQHTALRCHVADAKRPLPALGKRASARAHATESARESFAAAGVARLDAVIAVIVTANGACMAAVTSSKWPLRGPREHRDGRLRPRSLGARFESRQPAGGDVRPLRSCGRTPPLSATARAWRNRRSPASR